VIAAGGTGGHVMPALAVAEALRARGVEVSFIGARRGAATGLVRGAGYPEDTIPMRGMPRRPSPRALWSLALAAAALPRAAAILRRRHADVVVGAGGYVAGPVALAAWLTRRRVLLMEADSHLGIANRLTAPLARRVTLAFPLPGRGGRRYMVTGRPVGRAVVGATRTAGRRAFGIDPDETVVLVVGGSQGARTLNRAAVEAFGDHPPVHVIHATGPRQLSEVRRLLAAHDPGDRYRAEGYLENLPEAIAAADLVVSRAGGSVFELAAIGRPAILVPYPHATAHHQDANAAWMADAGAAVVVADSELDPGTLARTVTGLFADPRRLEEMSAASRALARPDAAERIAEQVLDGARR
jgi:UDP-N-acetylglucosamine--N-acetylmuramyl-(pentapeptide) pyrophosphoryl-undecaprenol N-acetylglucosamine transferase